LVVCWCGCTCFRRTSGMLKSIGLFCLQLGLFCLYIRSLLTLWHTSNALICVRGMGVCSRVYACSPFSSFSCRGKKRLSRRQKRPIDFWCVCARVCMFTFFRLLLLLDDAEHVRGQSGAGGGGGGMACNTLTESRGIPDTSIENTGKA
jgi:hypothetical protein